MQANFGLDDILVAKASHCDGDNGLIEKYVGKGISVIGKSKKLDKTALVEADLNFKHIFL